MKTKMIHGLTSALTGAALILGGAHAAHADRTYELGGFAGGHFFSSNSELGAADDDTRNNAPQSTYMFGVRFAAWITPHVGFEGELGIIPSRTRDDTTDVTAIAWRAHAMYNFLGEGRFQPFVLGGLGALSLSSADNKVLHEDTDAQFHFGVGVKIAVTDKWGIRVDGRLLLPPERKDSSFTEEYEALVGVYGLFPQRKKPVAVADRDHDGIPDADDKCPDEAGTKELGGCAVHDRDHDGIPDEEDKCPDEAGTKELGGCAVHDRDHDGIPDDQDKCPDEAGTPDRQGCALHDRDHDGVPDEEDKCPDEAGLKERQGCAVHDRDGDGIEDNVDKCPDAPETKNGYQDEDGCPDEVPKDVKKFTGAIQGITFETGKAVIAKSSNKTLDEAADVLKKNPTVKLEISGHTDDAGDHDTNVKLSQERADAVKAYLVGKGVDAARLSAKGYGPDKPVGDNKTPKGRQQNRRVEFQLQ